MKKPIAMDKTQAKLEQLRRLHADEVATLMVLMLEEMKVDEYKRRLSRIRALRLEADRMEALARIKLSNKEKE